MREDRQGELHRFKFSKRGIRTTKKEGIEDRGPDSNIEAAECAV